MTRLRTAFVAACTLALPLFGAGVAAQAPHTFEHGHDHRDIVVTDSGDSGSRRYLGGLGAADRSGGVSTTPDNQILVELAPEDTGPANLFDLNGRTLVFTPEGHGRYSRSVQPVAWEDEIGRAVADGEEIHLQSFMFDFAGHRWGSFFVSRRGVITFGEPLAYQYWDDGNRFGTMLQAAGSFVTTPTISPLFKPLLDEHGGGTLAVERFTDRVVVTWIAKDFAYDVFDPKLSRFQVVLDADGSIRFSYADVNFGDGIVGLFDDRGVERGRLLTNVADPTDSDLPGHLDLLDAAIYATNAESMVVLKFTLREPIPDPGAGEVFSYRLYFDTDEPYWTHPDWSDEDAVWLIHVSEGGEYAARGEGVVRFLGGRGKAKLSLLADASVLGGDGRRVAAMAFTNAAHFRNDEHVEADFSSTTLLEFSTPRGRRVDLSASESQFVRDHAEIFHYRSAPDTQEIACRVIEALGDDFDLLVFHAEFRLDSQEARTAWYAYDTGVEGVGRRFGSAPCGYGRLKGHWVDPVWMRSFLFGEAHVPESHRFDGGLTLFAHEFGHSWTAWASYDRNGQRELLRDHCCHWRWELHAPAAFPWHEEDDAYPTSTMGGRYWLDNGDGTFTPRANDYAGGYSWLDLYMMGLVEAEDVPDMVILRNLEPVRGDDPRGPHVAEKEIVTIQQVVDAEGSREPSAAESQKDFNAGFVYLLEPGQTPDPHLVRLHAKYRDKVIEHWSHVTGGRSRITTAVPHLPNASPLAVGALPDVTLRVGGADAIDVTGAFQDPDDDALAYVAGSSVEAVATATVQGSTVTVTPVAPGAATITVTASDIAGNTAAQRFTACVVPDGKPAAEYQRYLTAWDALGGGSRGQGCGGSRTLTFTDHPIEPGTTSIRAVHFVELREHIAALRGRVGLPLVQWTDATLTAGVTPVRRVHLTELREALGDAYDVSDRPRPHWTDPMVAAGRTPIQAVHIMELRAAVVALDAALPPQSPRVRESANDFRGPVGSRSE